MKVIPIQDSHTFISNFIRAEAMDPDRKQTWLQYKAKLAEVRKRIHKLVEDRYILAVYLHGYLVTKSCKFEKLRFKNIVTLYI